MPNKVTTSQAKESGCLTVGVTGRNQKAVPEEQSRATRIAKPGHRINIKTKARFCSFFSKFFNIDAFLVNNFYSGEERSVE